jgi:hypothetical protein
MGIKRGQKNQIRRTSQKRDGNATRDSDSRIGQTSGKSEHEQVRDDCPDWVGEHSAVDPRESANNCGEGNTGKILSQLRGLKEAHLAYVKAHEERLEARLNENREHQLKVIAEMNRLEREIIELLEEQKKVPTH